MSQPWTCETCGQKLRGHWAHCGVCCETFGGVEGFDLHLKSLVNAGCRTPEQIAGLRSKAGATRLYANNLNGVRVWQKPAPVAFSRGTSAHSG